MILPKFLQLQSHGDERGSLISLEEFNNIPFEIKRIYYLFNTSKGVKRGYHAHKTLKQAVIALQGSCMFHLDDGHSQADIKLFEPNKALFIDSFIWREIYDFSDDCLLLVLADQVYNEDDYIRDYQVFLQEINGSSMD
jgi:dTDP-4-dehydrorhamnose 3,5-epimerase-like enzyme